MTSESKEEEVKEDILEEAWGDQEIGLVLKEAASSWEAETSYKEELVAWCNDHMDDFVDYVGLPVDECEHKLHFSDLHSGYLSIFEKQITRFVKREGYSAEDFFAEVRTMPIASDHRIALVAATWPIKLTHRFRFPSLLPPLHTVQGCFG